MGSGIGCERVGNGRQNHVPNSRKTMTDSLVTEDIGRTRDRQRKGDSIKIRERNGGAYVALLLPIAKDKTAPCHQSPREGEHLRLSGWDVSRRPLPAKMLSRSPKRSDGLSLWKRKHEEQSRRGKVDRESVPFE